MISHHVDLKSAVFITFPGNCKKALTFYQTCFGGSLQFQTFERSLGPLTEMPIVSASLISDRIIIHGSDLVHDEGWKTGNSMAIFLYCASANEREYLLEKFGADKKEFIIAEDDQKLIELTDAFDVRWVLGV